MNFNFPEGRKPTSSPSVEVGNIYQSKNTHKTAAWVVVAMSGNTVHLLGIDGEGQVSSTQSYGLHAISGRDLIGRVDLSSINFDVEAV